MNREQAKIVLEMTDEQLIAVHRECFIKNKELIKAYVEGKKILFEYVKKDFLHFTSNKKYYLIEKLTKTINGITCPMHETVKPPFDKEYFFEDITQVELCGMSLWKDDHIDNQLFGKNIVHFNEEDAAKCCKARYGIE